MTIETTKTDPAIRDLKSNLLITCPSEEAIFLRPLNISKGAEVALRATLKQISESTTLTVDLQKIMGNSDHLISPIIGFAGSGVLHVKSQVIHQLLQMRMIQEVPTSCSKDKEGATYYQLANSKLLVTTDAPGLNNDYEPEMTADLIEKIVAENCSKIKAEQPQNTLAQDEQNWGTDLSISPQQKKLAFTTVTGTDSIYEIKIIDVDAFQKARREFISCLKELPKDQAVLIDLSALANDSHHALENKQLCMEILPIASGRAKKTDKELKLLLPETFESKTMNANFVKRMGINLEFTT